MAKLVNLQNISSEDLIEAYFNYMLLMHFICVQFFFFITK